MNIADILTPLSVYPVATVTADGLGSAIDLAEYEGELAIFVAVSAGSGNMTCDINVHDSDTSGGSYTAVTGSAITQVTTTASIQKISLDSNQMKRFIKLNIDVGGTSPSFLISAVGAAVKKTV